MELSKEMFKRKPLMFFETCFSMEQEAIDWARVLRAEEERIIRMDAHFFNAKEVVGLIENELNLIIKNIDFWTFEEQKEVLKIASKKDCKVAITVEEPTELNEVWSDIFEKFYIGILSPFAKSK